MKRTLWLFTSLTMFIALAARGQGPGTKPGDIGPGEQGAKLRLPGMDTPTPSAPSASPAMPAVLQNHINANPANTGLTPIGSFGASKIAQPPSMATDINKDIEVTPEAGSWLLLLKAYTGTEAPQLARALVMELRTNYNIKAAYIFNYGAEEKMKEYERVKAAHKKQVDDLAKAGLKGNYVPIPVRAAKIDEQTGVLIGGFRDRDQALASLATVRKLKSPDPVKFKFDVMFVGELETDKKGNVKKELNTKSYVEGGVAYVNPFSKAFPVRNPSIKHDQGNGSMSAEELALLRKMNRREDEDCTLFDCKSKYTLVVKQFNTQYKIGSDVELPKGWFEQVFGKKQGEWQDNAGHNAHKLAEAFRKTGLPETYVLHTRFCSFVTVGGFDEVNDRRMIAMQDFLESRFRTEAYRKLEMLPRPVPMIVPH
jgi:hypothetical protein